MAAGDRRWLFRWPGRYCRPRELQPPSRHDDDLAFVPCTRSCRGRDAGRVAGRDWRDTSDRRTNGVVTAVAHARALTSRLLAGVGCELYPPVKCSRSLQKGRGASWSADRDLAKSHALQARQVRLGGSVLLQASARPEAIVVPVVCLSEFLIALALATE